ncbi:MAG TPA: peptide chain release factor N(5)-glutamine methyltransferase [Acidimicrobiia bacterium]|nr:peptide chain release factor N(5)-glutamine methyltransferase [Acidimicrobiia bacterium]
MPIPAHELDRLRRAVTGRSRSSLAIEPVLTADEQRRVAELIRRRTAGEPLQYLEGTVDFGPLTLKIDERALIPRPETERLWEEAVRSLGEAGPGSVIVDLGTGSGCLALALKHAFAAARVFGIDVSADALALAGENAAFTGLDVTFLHGDLFAPLPDDLEGRVDLVVSNPPYVADGDHLPGEIKDHEPHQALFAGPQGTEMLARIAEEAYWMVGVGGWVLCEIGDGQADEAKRLFGAYDREVRKDLAGRDRILVARKGASCCP